MAANKIEDLISLCKRRGFVYPGSEIYGGLKGTYDYGPLGIELKNNLKEAWWQSMVYERDDIEGLEGSLISHRNIWYHSGHEEALTDLLVDCKNCKARLRLDKLVNGKCDNCGGIEFTEPREFNLLFPLNVGPVVDNSSKAYLRGETAQITYINFKNVLDSTSRKLPFGIVQVGKSFRNEIIARNFLFRTREFEQMELQFFITPGEEEEWFKKWKEIRYNWWIKQGLKTENLRWHKHDENELVFYCSAAEDIYYNFPHGFDELEGIHNRTDYDLGSHTKNQRDFNITAKVKENNDSIFKLSYTDKLTQKTFIPYVIETAAGLGRGLVAILNEAYTDEKLEDGSTRLVLKLARHLSPIKVAIIPLAKNKPQIVEKAKEIKSLLQKLKIGRVIYEDIGNVGKAYRRHDEIGTPICITVDYDTFENYPNTVTVRDRDTMFQERIHLNKLIDYVKGYYSI